ELVAATAPPEPVVAAKSTGVRLANARSPRGRNSLGDQRAKQTTAKAKLAEQIRPRRTHVKLADHQPTPRAHAKHAKADPKNLAALKTKSLPTAQRRGTGKRTKVASG